MKAAIINSYGSPEVFQYQDVEKPQIKNDHLLVKVHASSVNPIDWKARKGLLAIFTGINFPIILGFDVSGEVVEVGNNVTRFKPGDLIFASAANLPGGTYAEYVAIAEQVAAFKPANMTHEQAAAVPLAAMTALQALRDEAKIKAGQQVLINGASGGVGIYAIQIAKALETEVTAVCSAKNSELVKSLGADYVIDYQQEDFAKSRRQYDIVFDVIGNHSFFECLNVLKSGGVFVSTQPLPGNFLESALSWFIPDKEAKVIILKSNSNDLTYLKELIEANKIQTVIDCIYPLSEIAAAHTQSETERAIGKIVIKVLNY